MISRTCPHCDTERIVYQHELGSEVTCAECGGRFVAEERPRRRGRRDDERPRGRYNPTGNHRVSGAATFLLFVTCLQVLAHVVVVIFLLRLLARELPKVQAGQEVEAVLYVVFILGIGAALILKDAVVLYGIASMRGSRRYTWAVVGAAVALIPDVGWVFAAPAAALCLFALMDRDVRHSFDAYRRTPADDS